MTLGTFFTTLYPIGILIFVFLLVAIIQKHSFKELSQRFESTEDLPFSVRPRIFKYGYSRMKNVTKVAEQGENIFIKLWCMPILKIPYNAFLDIQIKVNNPKHPFVLFRFKDPELKPLSIQFKKDQLQNFPVLLKRMEAVTSSYISTAINSQN